WAIRDPRARQRAVYYTWWVKKGLGCLGCRDEHEARLRAWQLIVAQLLFDRRGWNTTGHVRRAHDEGWRAFSDASNAILAREDAAPKVRAAIAAHSRLGALMTGGALTLASCSARPGRCRIPRVARAVGARSRERRCSRSLRRAAAS